MKRLRWIPVPLAACFVLLLAAVLASAPQSPSIAPRDRIIVLISLDGFPAFALDDPRLPAPALRRLAAEGVQARRMLTINPSVTWPTHTTMVTGVRPARHGVLMNGALARNGPGRPVAVERYRDRADILRAPTVYDLARASGLSTAQVNWVAIQNAPSIQWQFDYRPNPKGVVEREMVTAGLATEQEIAGFGSGTEPWKDQIWTRAAVHILSRYRPNLVLFHLLALDDLHHRYGPGSLGGAAGIALVDARLGEFVEAIRRHNLADRTTVLIVSDHGFKPAPRRVRPNAFLREHGFIRRGPGGTEADAYLVAQGGNAMVYVTDPANGARLLPRLEKLLAGLEGVARVVKPSEYAALGLPQPSENGAAGDLVLFAKDGYWFHDEDEGPVVLDTVPGTTVGTHGYPAADGAMDAIFIAWGYGIRKGARLDTVSITDVAPTIAEMLGIRMPNVEGRPLHEIMLPAAAAQRSSP